MAMTSHKVNAGAKDNMAYLSHFAKSCEQISRMSSNMVRIAAGPNAGIKIRSGEREHVRLAVSECDHR